MNPFAKKYFQLLSIVSLVVLLDQWTKWLVRTNLPFNSPWLPDSLSWLSPYARFVFIFNKGAAFGMFQNGNLFFTIAAFLVLGGILYYYSQLDSDSWTLRFGTGLYLSGVLGNLIDRLALGQVTDFISVGSFYIFNIADASINVGVVLLLLGFWLSERKKNNDLTTNLSPNGESL